ncbi:DUF2252 domain-containing protein [Adhaeribacter sp. BT258]|uniref:DUF2252 domain-containing protein n=1 Tax=Adhaeribacter terrigena TaxID=2793070 RepID=A0ABS1BXF9_9BACT|nr:DUF2252 domain-containing protein [Adhaeribacter terrigena]MBK0401759.1 DUF2252 domain-containing protein [Adhaeribacter terrigena]
MKVKPGNEGKKLRQKLKRNEQGTFKLPPNRPTIAAFIKADNVGRLQNLVPIRHARMSKSPFTFYRATASVMAYDLAFQPHTKVNVQAIGDAHLANFGGFATPERSLIFDANDFDETNPAPWEWDLKRLATSFVLAAREKGIGESTTLEIARNVSKYYRESMQEFAAMNILDLWYIKFDLEGIRDMAKVKRSKKQLDKLISKGQKQSIQKELYKMAISSSGNFVIKDQPPLVYHPFDIDKSRKMIEGFFKKYAETLQSDRKWLFNQYKMVDLAMKVVGVGSVGTPCFVALLMNKKDEPLFLQIKEAGESALEPFTGKSIYKHHGQRVVAGQRLVQAASDVFLGWSTGPGGRQFYVRQLKDKKISPDIETFDKAVLKGYAKLCGRMLARAHAKTGPSSLLAGYMGKREQLDMAIGKFAVAYANQTERDFAEFMKAIKSGKLKASFELPD